VLFIGLNPSTADENVDDATVIRCIGYAQAWGMQAVVMGNLLSIPTEKPTSEAVPRRWSSDENDSTQR